MKRLMCCSGSSCIFVMQVAYVYLYLYHNKAVLGRYIVIEFKLSLCSRKRKS